MADDQFDPNEFAAAKTAAPPAPTDDSFNPDEFAAHKDALTGTVPVEQPGIADAVGKVAHAAFVDYPKNVYEAGKNAVNAFSEGVDPSSETNKKIMSEAQESPITGAVKNLGSSARAVAAVPEFLAAPFTGAIKTVAPAVSDVEATAIQAAGEPIARALKTNPKLPTHEQVSQDIEPDVETALGLAVPGKAKVPATAAPLPAPPNDPFGVTMSVGQDTGHLPTIQEEQSALRNSSGAKAQAVAQKFADQQKAQLEASKDVATAQLSPTGQIEARTPDEAGEVISNELRNQEAARKTAVDQQRAGLDQEAEAIRPKNLLDPHEAANTVAQSLRDTADSQTVARRSNETALAADREGMRRSYSPDGTVIASNPQEAADVISAGVTRAEEIATQQRDQAYENFANTPGSFQPKAFTNIGNDIRRELNDPKDPVILNDKTTPMAIQAINDLDSTLGETARIAADPATKSFEPLTPSKIDDYRKRLGAAWRQARQTANSTNDYSDLRAMGRVQDAFDDTVSDAMKKKRLFNGNPKAVSDAWDSALAAHRALRQTFSPQGKGDTVGPVMTKIVGQREGQAAPANQIDQWTTGNGATPVLVGRRLQQIFGPQSPEIGAVKQSLFSKAIEPTPGMPGYDAETIAGNLDKLRGSELGRLHFTPQELAEMRQHAIDLRNSVAQPRPKTDVVGSAIDKANGVGGQPWTSSELSGKLFGRTGGGDDPLGVKLAQHVKSTYGEGSDEFRAVQRGQLSSLLRGNQGRAGFDPEAIAGDVREFVTGKGKPMADTLYSPDQQKGLLDYADRLDAHAKRVSDFETAQKIPNNPVDRAVARITGRETGTPATARDVINMATGRNGDKTVAVGIMKRLKQTLPPEKFAAIKQGLFRRMIEPGPTENGANWGPARVASQMARMFNEFPELMRSVYEPKDVDMMRAYQDMNRKLAPPQAGVQWSNNAPFIRAAMRTITYGIGAALGAAVVPLPYVGEIAGAGAVRMIEMMKDARTANRIAKLMPMVGDKMAQYQKALNAAQRTGLPGYQKRSAIAAGELGSALRQIGVTRLQGPAAAGAQQQDQNNIQGVPPQKKHGGGVDDKRSMAHRDKVSDSLKPEMHPQVSGARLAHDGHYYLSDPNRPGKFLRVVERARRSAA